MTEFDAIFFPNFLDPPLQALYLVYTMVRTSAIVNFRKAFLHSQFENMRGAGVFTIYPMYLGHSCPLNHKYLKHTLSIPLDILHAEVVTDNATEGHGRYCGSFLGRYTARTRLKQERDRPYK
jgi:hypothetical protein